MDELIYRFLLQSGFPRAAIVTDLSLLPLAGAANGGADVGTNGEARHDGSGIPRPSFAIVDPRTGDRLALVDVAGAIDGDDLHAAAGALGAYGQRFGGRAVQGFVVRVDTAGGADDERVQFYRVWPNETLERVSAQAFPDLDSMRTWQLLAERRERAAVGAADDAVARSASVASFGAPTLAARAEAFGDDDEPAREAHDDGSGAGGRRGRMAGWTWLPGLALAGLAVVDALAERFAGQGLLSVVQALLLIGAATLLLVPALGRRG